MTRAKLDSSSRSEISGPVVREIAFIYIPFPSGTLAICTEGSSFTFTDPDLGSLTFAPGGIVTIDNLNENDTGQAERSTLTISGCDPTLISTVVGDATHFLQVAIWLGYLNAAGTLVASPPYRVFNGFLGSPTIQTGANSSVIAITAETLNVALARISQVRGCDADQQARFAGDTIFHQVAVQGRRAIVFGNFRNGGGGNFDTQPGVGHNPSSGDTDVPFFAGGDYQGGWSGTKNL